MNKSTIKVENQTKKLLDDLKYKYSYSTYENCIKSLASFILENEIDPTDSNLGNFKNSLIDIEVRISKSIENTQKKLNADNISLRKWVGAIERDYLVPIKNKIENTDISVKVEAKEIISNTPNNPLNNNLSGIDKDLIYKEDIRKLNSQILEEREKVEEVLLNFDKQNTLFNKIISAAKIEEGGMISKERITIEMSVDEWKKMINSRI